MSCLKANFVLREPNCGLGLSSSFRVCSSIGILEINPPNSDNKTLNFSDQNAIKYLKIKTPNLYPAQPLTSTAKSQNWWEKSLQPNMVEIQSSKQLVNFLQNAGDTLVVLGFYSPECGGCRTLHPKICQIAETNPTAVFLNVNYEQNRAMCRALHVHVLPFFKFYGGAEGRLCSFSCTNATIGKFKDALAKHGMDRRSLSRAKGLEEKELASLVSLGLISKLNYAEEDGSLCVMH